MDKLLSFPVIQATFQAEVLSIIGNSIAQLINGWRKEDVNFDWGVLGLSLIVQLLLVPPNFYWQLYLEAQFPTHVATEKSESQDPLPLQNIHPLNGQEDQSDISVHAQLLAKDDAQETGSVEDAPVSDFDHASIPDPPKAISIRNTAIKWFIDCFLIGLWVNIVAFIAVWGVLRGHSILQIRQSLRDDFLRLFLDALKLWPAASVVGLTLVRAEMRMVFYTAVGMCWGIYITIVAVLP